jgi:hypothetical protein
MQEQAKKPHDRHFPKWKYHKNGKSKMIQSKAAEDLLGDDWKDSPALHGNHAHPHSDEQLAEMAALDGDQNDGLEPLEEDKPKRGRPFKKLE